MKRVFALLLCVMLVVACFSGCGEPLSKDKEYDVETIGNTEFWHTYGDLSNLRAGTYPILIPNYDLDEERVISVAPGEIQVIEVYGNHKNPYEDDGSVFVMVQVLGSSGGIKTYTIKEGKGS